MVHQTVMNQLDAIRNQSVINIEPWFFGVWPNPPKWSLDEYVSTMHHVSSGVDR